MRIVRNLTAAIAVVALTVAGIATAVANDPPPRIAFLANGIVPADALAAGPVAGQLGAPIFTTAPDALVESTATALTAHAPELVIVMGGPAAISDVVLGQVAAATGLTVVPSTPPPTSGIVRAAGQDRFETAAAAAALLAAYDPAFLPTDMKAVDSDTLDGKDSSAFQPAGAYALADRTCTAGKVVTGIAADGTPTCATDRVGTHGGDADTLDGKDSTEFQPAGDYALADQTCALGNVVSGITALGQLSCSTDAVDGGDAETLDGLDSSAFTQTPSTRTITFTHGSLAWTQDPSFLETSEGLLWGADPSVAAGYALTPPPDWDGGDVDVTLYFAPLTGDPGDIQFFTRPQSFTEGDTVGDIAGVSSPAVPSAGEDVLLSQTIVVPSTRLDGTDVWRMRFQRNTTGDDTYPSSVVVLAITVTYHTI